MMTGLIRECRRNHIDDHFFMVAIPALNTSKTLKALNTNQLFQEIMQQCVAIFIGKQRSPPRVVQRCPFLPHSWDSSFFSFG